MCLSPRMKATQREEKALLKRLKLWEILENQQNELEEEEIEHLEQLTANKFDLTPNEILAIHCNFRFKIFEPFFLTDCSQINLF